MKPEITGADDMVGTDQPHLATLGKHQDNVADLPDDTPKWIKNLIGLIHHQEVKLLRKN